MSSLGVDVITDFLYKKAYDLLMDAVWRCHVVEFAIDQLGTHIIGEGVIVFKKSILSPPVSCSVPPPRAYAVYIAFVNMLPSFYHSMHNCSTKLFINNMKKG